MEPKPRNAGWVARPEAKAWRGYAAAVGGTAVAAVARWAIGRWVGEVPPFITFYPVVIAAAVLGGTGAGALAALLGGVAADYFFIPPIGRFWPLTAGHVAGISIFIGINLAISVVGGRLRAAYGQLRLQVAALRESEERFRTLADAMPQLAWIAQPDGWIYWYNRRWHDYTGTTPEQMAGWGWQSVHDPQALPAVLERWKGSIATGEPFNMVFPLRGADGRCRPFLTRVMPLKDEQGRVLQWFGTNTDISEQKRVELELAGLRDRLAAELSDMKRLHQVSTRFVRQGDLQALLEAVLDGAIAITGATKGHVQLLDGASGELGIAVHRGYDPAFVAFFSHIRAGTVACGTAMQTRQCVIVEDVTLSPLFRAEPRALELMLAAGVRAVVCTPLVAGSGRGVGVLSAHFGARHHPAERELRLLEMLASQAADFIERRKTEEALRSAQEELARANAALERKVQERTTKLREAIEELEGFSYSLVHDMRAPLRAMQAYASVLEEDSAAGLDLAGLDYLRKIKIAALRMDQLITDSLNYSRILREDLPMEPVHLGQLLRGLVETYPNLQALRAEIHLEVQDLMVLGNAAALTQVFSNLLGNAVKFVAPGVKPRVRVWAQERNNGPASAEESKMENQKSQTPKVLIWVEDNGIGIPKEGQEKIFGMFERLHRSEEYPGTGVGLAIVRKTLERLGGRVCLESEPGKGSRFCVELSGAAQSVGAVKMEQAA